MQSSDQLNACVLVSKGLSVIKIRTINLLFRDCHHRPVSREVADLRHCKTERGSFEPLLRVEIE